MRNFSNTQARSLTLSALGFARGRPAKRPGDAGVLKAIRALGLLQIDSVNVLTRAHTMPLFSRLGPYDRGALDRLAYKRRSLFEYWAHEASLLPIEDFPMYRMRMQAADAGHSRFREWVRKTGTLVDDVLAEVRERGPIGISEVSLREGRNSPWWGWPPAKSALEWLFIVGEVTTHTRRNFERIYDITERVIPAPLLAAPVPSRDDVRKTLLLRAAARLGVGTAADLADYHRLQHTRADLAALVAEGGLEQVRVDGWKQVAYVIPGTRAPRAVDARALVSPFDPLVWHRARAERLFDFEYRIEIYVPAPKRIYGYYVLPFLLGDSIAGRVDLKADRASGSLLVQAAHREEGVAAAHVASHLADELRLMAQWLELDDVVVAKKGNLSTALRRAI